MKRGAVAIVYIAFFIWSYTDRFYDVFIGIAFLILAFWLLSLIGRLIRSDRMVSFWQRKIKFLFKLEAIGTMSWLTWKLLNLIFN